MKIQQMLLLAAVFAGLGSLPMRADTYTTYPTPVSTYTSGTTDYGGGNGSLSTISSVGVFSFSSGLIEASVPSSYRVWNTPPAVESSTPDVLVTTYIVTPVSSITLTLSGSANTAGFELDPVFSGINPVAVSFYNGASLIDTITLNLNGGNVSGGGAMLFALTDTTPGASISSIGINDLADETFAIAQLRAGELGAAATPEPSSLALLGTGLLGGVAMLRRRFDHRLKLHGTGT